MTKTFEEEFNYLIELSGKVLIGQVDAEKFEENRVAFFEKYNTGQQQTLPVVPEFVGSFLTGKSIFKIANGDIPDDVISWVQEQTYYVDLEKIISHLISIKVTGYKVEKPQLFRLKHIDISKSNINWDYYLKHGRNGNLEHSITKKGYVPTSNDFKFDQSEIDSMQTGSYELVPVEDGE